MITFSVRMRFRSEDREEIRQRAVELGGGDPDRVSAVDQTPAVASRLAIVMGEGDVE